MLILTEKYAVFVGETNEITLLIFDSYFLTIFLKFNILSNVSVHR